MKSTLVLATRAAGAWKKGRAFMACKYLDATWGPHMRLAPGGFGFLMSREDCILRHGIGLQCPYAALIFGLQGGGK